jgi:predicted enzyme related to lactoylglutathione lyase
MPRIVHLEIPTTNPKRSADFYKQALGWDIKQWDKVNYWMVTTGKDPEPGINGAIMPRRISRPP